MRLSTKFVLYAAAVVVMVLVQRDRALGQQQPFSIEIKTSKVAFEIGSQIELQIRLTNKSNRDIVLDDARDGTPPIVAGYPLDLYLHDENGGTPSETTYQRVRRGEEPPSDLGLFTSDGIIGVLSPGKSGDESMIVDRFYTLIEPGKYRIQLQWTNPKSKATVKSNTVVVTLIP